jgi:hypothetical protein
MGERVASVIPAFHDARHDPALRGHPREVYFWLHDRLDVREFRALKVVEVQIAVGIHKQRASDALARLIACGYLERGAQVDRVWTYRLFYSRVPKPDQKTA